MTFATRVAGPAGFLLLLCLLAFLSPARAQTCFFADDYSNPARWTQLNAGISVAGGGVQVTNTLKSFCNAPRARQLTVEVVAPDVAAVSYAQATLCRTGTAAVASFTPGGGTFSGSAGLVLDPATGVVDLARTPVGRYLLTYRSAGACAGAAHRCRCGCGRG